MKYAAKEKAEEGHRVEDVTIAENPNDIRARLTENLGHQIMDSANSVKLSEICSKGEAAEEGHLVEDETVAATNSKDLPVGKESVIGIDLNKIPTSKREEEVNQEEAVEIPEDQPDYEEVCGATGRVEMTPDATLDDRQNIYGFSEQSSVQMMYNPVMYRTDDNSVRMEQISHIKAQIRVSDDNPNMCPEEEASKPSIESFTQC